MSLIYISGNEKNIFEELLIKREQEENKAKDYVKRLISSPEGTQTEFKETFWRCTRTKENNNKDVIHSSIKNINAFFNTKGGDLVIGVRDYDRDVVGITFDGYKDDETYIRRIRDRIKNSMKGKFSHLFDITIVEIKKQKLCLITVEASYEPIFLHDKKYKDRELFYVREGDSAVLYEGRDMINYIQNAFYSDNDKNK